MGGDKRDRAADLFLLMLCLNTLLRFQGKKYDGSEVP